MIREILQRQFGHFSRPEQEDTLPGEVAEDLAREFDGGVAHRDGPPAEARLRPDSLAHVDRPLKEMGKDGTGGAAGGREAIRLFHLA